MVRLALDDRQRPRDLLASGRPAGGGGVLLLRLRVPESPRWLMFRGHEDEANKVVAA